MALPRKLKNFNMYGDGDSYLGQCAEVTLPKLEMAGEEYRGAGMLAPVMTDLGLNMLELEMTFGGIMVPVMRQWGVVKLDAVQLRFVGAYQADDSVIPAAAELVTRGRHKEIDPGTAKAGDDTEWKVASACSYLKWTINQERIIEIDVLRNVYIVGGVDRMAAIRAIIGS